MARGVATRLSRVEPVAVRAVGALALASLAATVVLGLWFTPEDQVMGNLVRLLYVHPPVAWVAYLAFGVTAACSIAYLWPRTRSPFWDRLGAASAEIGVVFCALTLATGSIWGRPTWGVWWTWDARLTTTALLLALFAGYLAIRRVTVDPAARAKRSAVVALVAFADVPIVHMSVLWWRTLHQPPTVFRPGFGDPTLATPMAWTLLLAFCAFTLAYVWLLAHRYRVAVLEARMEGEGLELALAERRAEAGYGEGPGGIEGGAGSGGDGPGQAPVPVGAR
ncbi:MAG TPA: cytochrome c biogenesis protein CcsA [Acidimicrobiales bacterium]|nr:cytochrome c biogenesis protein CcsA [Acidimicrobiales bacterium]